MAAEMIEFACRHRFAGGAAMEIAFRASAPVVSLFGPSGSGKTSVLNMIAGLLRPDEGYIRVGERVLLDTAARVSLPIQRRRVGYVFQDHLLFPHYSIEGNLRFGARSAAHRIPFERVVEVLELGPLLRRRPASLSGGERQRVALGRALLREPDLLLMDEPLAALDEALKLRVLTYLQRVVDEWRIPTLFVSHGQAEVRRLAQWVVVVARGKVLVAGTPDTVLARPELLGWRHDIGPMNLLRLDNVRHEHGITVAWLGEHRLQLPSDQGWTAGPCFATCPPATVSIAVGDAQGLSTRNQLPAIVRQRVDLTDRVFVALDVGPIVWAEITPAAAQELKLAPGMPVYCLMKTASLSLVG